MFRWWLNWIELNSVNILYFIFQELEVWNAQVKTFNHPPKLRTHNPSFNFFVSPSPLHLQQMSQVSSKSMLDIVRAFSQALYSECFR